VKFPVGLSGRFPPAVFADEHRISVVWTSYAQIDDANVPLYFSYSENGGEHYDTVLLASGLTNLWTDAIDAMQNGHAIHIISETADGIVIFSIGEPPIFWDGFESY